jgi:hypothetical protein
VNDREPLKQDTFFKNIKERDYMQIRAIWGNTL